MAPSPGKPERPALRPETFARLEVCVLAATPRLSDQQVLALAESLQAIVRARRRRPYDWLAPAARRRRGRWARRDPEGRIVDLWPPGGPELGPPRPR